MSPRESASSISFTKRPFSPILLKGESRILSPVVLIMHSSGAIPTMFSISPATRLACQSASLLPRVPMIRRSLKSPSAAPLDLIETEELAKGLCVDVSLFVSAQLLNAHDRLVPELVNDPAGQGG